MTRIPSVELRNCLYNLYYNYRASIADLSRPLVHQCCIHLYSDNNPYSYSIFPTYDQVTGKTSTPYQCTESCTDETRICLRLNLFVAALQNQRLVLRKSPRLCAQSDKIWGLVHPIECYHCFSILFIADYQSSSCLEESFLF